MDVSRMVSVSLNTGVPGNAMCGPRCADERRHNILVVSDVRLVRETIAEALARALTSASIHEAASLAEASARMDNGEPALVLIDATVHNGLAAANLLHRQGSTTRLVVFGMDDAVKDIALWTDAGIVAYPGRSLGLREIVELIGMVISNEAAVSASTAPLAHKAKSQSNSLSTATRGAQATLTAREDQVVRLVISGASNKEIARLLDISVATVKSHVHNLLGKLGLTGRGKLAVRYRGGHSSPDVMRAME